MRLYLFILLLGVSLFSMGCGGGSAPKTTPPPTMYTVGGSVSGLAGTGLVLQNNNGDNLAVSANATAFTFPTAIASGSAFKVSVMTQPSSPMQNCLVASGSGTANANIKTVNVTCTTATYTVGGAISGLVGTGLVLQDNGGDNLPVSANATGFTFATPVDSGSAYKVSVMTQPSSPAQNCIVASGTGSANGNITTVNITCTTVTYSVGGTISGLIGTGLVLQDNGGDNLPISANATGFTFATPVDSGSGYKVSVLTQPSSPMQSCAVTNASGTVSGNVATVNVACTTITYTVGGTISGLTGTGLVLQNNSGDNLTVSANATGFTFATKLDGGAGYSVSVLAQASNPTQNCGVSAGNGTSSVNITNVLVTCNNINEWTWENGPQAADQSGIYGTQGAAGTGNTPGARYWGTSWSDANGNFWLFGGYGYDSLGTVADTNDLWEGSRNSTGQWTWTWVGGANVAGVGGTYGTPGLAGANNVPGARDSAVSWTDASGNFWLFGGHGYDSARTADNLNDLWKYSAGAWTWVSGSNLVNQKGTYGTLGTADPANVPGARYSSVSWIDKQGNLWLFGGLGYDSVGTIGFLNDLWEGSADSTGQWTWTWVSGSNVAGVKGTYSGSSAVPGARYLSTSWTDTQGNLWMFGGYGNDSAGNTANLSDVWEFNAASRSWTFAGGLQTAGASGTYGTLGVTDLANLPGSRKGAVSWTDSTGNFWLFGGIGFDSAGVAGELNDLWVYNPTTGAWTWESGSNLVGQVGTYGTLGTGDPSNVPGARGGSPNWIDAAGNLWLFGGNGPISGVNGSFSDLWKFVP
jgi:hypothetical protein